MTKTFFLALSLLISAAWAQAQTQYPQSGSNPAGTEAGQTTVRGCLHGSDGNYTLTADDGTAYQLQGDTSKFGNHVGHEVQITGSMTSGSAASSPNSTPSAAAPPPTLTAERLKHISETCSSGNKQ